MDKRNTTIGILLLIAALALMYLAPQTPPPPPQSAPADDPAATPPPPHQPGGGQTLQSGGPAADPSQSLRLGQASTASSTMFAPLAPNREDEVYVTLENERVAVRFTNYGGAIADVALKQHRRSLDSEEPLVLNAVHHAPILAFSGLAGADQNARYEQVSATATEVVYRAVVQDQLEITRTYRISRDPDQQDPYVIHNETVLRNLGTNTVNLSAQLNLGTGRPVHNGDDPNLLTVGRFDGEDANFTPRTQLDQSSGFLGLFGGHPARPLIEHQGPIVWATVENQFFTTIVTPARPGRGVIAQRVELPMEADEFRPNYGLTGAMLLPSVSLAPGATDTLTFDVYAGPKEYQRLARLGQDQDKVMRWGTFIGFFSKLLLTLMTALHSFIGNWGVAIIATTVVIRTLMWPLTGMSTRAAKRMAKIQGPLKEIQEKYKDNRAKQQEETLKLFKQHKVNPLGGCLPLLIQMPIFFGLFSMLRTASELRFANFLWIQDLSAPDTIARIPGIGFPINLMVLLMGATQIIQMRLTPAPSTDNASARMMKFMPYFIVAICYNFSSGLAVYWTASNAFSIFQQWVTNRQKDPVEVAPAKPGAAERAKPVRDAKVANVAKPKKRK